MNAPAVRWALVACWMALNAWLSHQPQLPGPSFPFIDKVEHAAFFGIFAFLLARAWLPRLADRTPRERAALLLTATLLWAVVDEVHQSFVPGRSADPFDVLADLAGGALVAAAMPGARMKS